MDRHYKPAPPASACPVDQPEPVDAPFQLPDGIRQHYNIPAARDADSLFSTGATGASQPLPFRGEMEDAYGADFSGVRAYLGRAAVGRALGAHAATRGDEVVFADVRPQKEHVAHELAHVVQTRQHGSPAVQAKSVVEASAPAEREADRAASEVIAGKRPRLSERPGSGIHLARAGTEKAPLVLDDLRTLLKERGLFNEAQLGGETVQITLEGSYLVLKGAGQPLSVGVVFSRMPAEHNPDAISAISCRDGVLTISDLANLDAQFDNLWKNLWDLYTKARLAAKGVPAPLMASLDGTVPAKPLPRSPAVTKDADQIVQDIKEGKRSGDAPDDYLIPLSEGLAKPPPALVEFLKSVNTDGPFKATEQHVAPRSQLQAPGYDQFASGGAYGRLFKDDEVQIFFKTLFEQIAKKMNALGVDVKIHPYDLYHFHMQHYIPPSGDKLLGELVLIFHAKEYPVEARGAKQREAHASTKEPALDFSTEDDAFSYRNYAYAMDTQGRGSLNMMVPNAADKTVPDVYTDHKFFTADESRFGGTLGNVNMFADGKPTFSPEHGSGVSVGNGHELLTAMARLAPSADVRPLLLERPRLCVKDLDWVLQELAANASLREHISPTRQYREGLLARIREGLGALRQKYGSVIREGEIHDMEKELLSDDMGIDNRLMWLSKRLTSRSS